MLVQLKKNAANMIYRVKHVPTGLYYQPQRHHGSNLSTRGKVYQTAKHGLSHAFRHKQKVFRVYVEKNGSTKFYFLNLIQIDSN